MLVSTEAVRYMSPNWLRMAIPKRDDPPNQRWFAMFQNPLFHPTAGYRDGEWLYGSAYVTTWPTFRGEA